MQLDVITSVRKGVYPTIVSPVLASDILNILRACRQIYEEAHAIFWAENAFVFPSLDTLHLFLHRISARSFGLIRMIGVEKTVNIEWIDLKNGCLLGCWFPDTRLSPFGQPLPRYGWQAKLEEYDCLRDHWVSDSSNPSELRIKKFQIQCKTSYSWLKRLSSNEMESTKDASATTNDASDENCAMEPLSRRRCLVLSEAVRRLS